MNGTQAPLSSTHTEFPGEPAPPSSGRSRRTTLALVAAFIVLVFLAIFLPPLVNLGKYRRSIASSISLALGRPVYISALQLRLLPLPGIVLSDFTVAEDPAFGYEPVLHANSVVAYLRLSSLWRGRLEVSRISLDEASLNLVKNDAGDWNIASILLRASQIPNAPTAERHAGAHPRFPYIEASDSRINFKQGVEKKPFSLMSADFSMWQAGSDEWRLRLKAQPVRTDLELHLSDTGLVTLQGSLHRAPNLDAMPVSLTAEWSGAQLGQVSSLLAGSDSGWRGDLDLTATLRGTAANLAVRSRLRIADLRRLEFQPVNTVDVDASCQAAWHHQPHTFTAVTCFWPISAGHLLLTSDALTTAPLGGNLQLELNQIPAQFPLSLLGLVRPRLAALTAGGVLNGSFALTAPHPSAQAGTPALPATLTGHADATQVALTAGGHTLALPTLHFVTQPGASPRSPRAGRHTPPPPAQPNSVLLEPVSLPFGAPQPLIAEARLTRTGFALHLTGQASLARLTTAAAHYGLLGNSLAALAGDGRAVINTTTASDWLSALASPAPARATTGSIRLQNVQFHPTFLHAPLAIDSADLFLTPEQTSWQNVAFHYQNLALHGSLQIPGACGDAQPCPIAFSLTSPTLDAAALDAALLARPRSGLIGQFFSDALGASKPAPWPALHGTIQSGTLQLGRLAVHNATAAVTVEGTSLTLTSLAGTTLGGAFHASGSMSLATGTPAWALTAQITGARASDAAALFHQHWGAGLLTGDLKLTASGYHLPALLDSASGDFRATWQNGGLPGAGSSASGAALPLNRFDRWTAAGTLGKRTLTLTSGTLTRAGHSSPIHGVIGFDRHLSLTIQTHRGPVTVTGTLAQPATSR